jgi:hypothetical protein
MTNLMVLACLPAGPVRPETVAAELKPRLERYDRTRPVPPYRREFGVSLTEFAKRLAAIGNRDDADLDAMDLPNHLTAWRFLAEHHNADLFEESERLYIDDDARPYTMSTANPDGHIDRWWIGGLWAGRFPAVTTTGQGLICPARDGQRWCCAGGVVHALDLSGMRRDAATAAHAAYRRWQSTVAGTPPATPWQEYIERHHADPGGHPLKKADEDFPRPTTGTGTRRPRRLRRLRAPLRQPALQLRQRRRRIPSRPTGLRHLPHPPSRTRLRAADPRRAMARPR